MHVFLILCIESGLSCPKVGVIVPLIFLLRSTTQILSISYKDLITLCMPNKIYKIDSVPARLLATGRLLEYLAFTVFLDTGSVYEWNRNLGEGEEKGVSRAHCTPLFRGAKHCTFGKRKRYQLVVLPCRIAQIARKVQSPVPLRRSDETRRDAVANDLGYKSFIHWVLESIPVFCSYRRSIVM